MEAKVIQQFFPNLISAVGACVQNVSDHCLAEGLIEKTTQEKVLESAGTEAGKARILMCAVRDTITRNPTCFDVFINVLEEVLPRVDYSLLKAMKAAMTSNISDVEESQIPSPLKSQITCGSSDSTAAKNSDICQLQPSSKPSSEGDFIHYDHAVKGIDEESDSTTSAISEDAASNIQCHKVNTASSESSHSQVAGIMITYADCHKGTAVLNQSCTLHAQAEEAVQGATLCKITQTSNNSDDSNELSVVEVQGEYLVKLNQDFEDLQCTSASHSTKSTLTELSDSTSNSSSRERAVEDLKHVMRVDLKQIRKKFVKLQSDVRVSLRGVPLEDIIGHVLGYVKVFDPDSDKKVPLLPEETLRSAASTDQLFYTLQKQWNFLECDLLVSIVEQCCHSDETICKKIKEYHNDLKEFFEKRKLSEFPEDLSLSNSTDEAHEEVVMKLDLNDPTLKEIKELKSKICEILDIMPSTLLISEIRSGCVEITFLIPVHISEYVFGRPITDAQREILKAALVLKFTWRNKTEIFADEKYLDDPLGHHDDTSNIHCGRTPTLKETDYKKESRDSTKLTWTIANNKAKFAYRRYCDTVIDGNRVYYRRDCQLWTYNICNKEWLQLVDCDYTSSSLIILNGLLTTIGGDTDKLMSLTTEQKWKEIYPRMPTKRKFVAAVCTATALIVAGGRATENSEVLKRVEVLHTDNHQWSTAVDLPEPLYSCSVTVYGDQFYMLGGLGGQGTDDDHDSGTKSVYTCSVNALLKTCTLKSSSEECTRSQSRSNVWSQLADLPVTESTCVTFHGQLLAVGGMDSNMKPTATIYVYNPSTHSWNVDSHMITARCRPFVTVLPNNQLMVVGGEGGTGTSLCTDSVEFGIFSAS